MRQITADRYHIHYLHFLRQSANLDYASILNCNGAKTMTSRGFVAALSAIFLSVFLSVGINSAYAATEQINVCAKFKRHDGSFSPNYRLTAIWTQGEALNQGTGLIKFIPNHNYLVLPVDPKTSSWFTGVNINKPVADQRFYQDQDGTTWAISRGWGKCH